MNEEKQNKKKIRFTKLRGIVFLGVLALVVIGLIFHTGTGTLSAFGIDSIAALCPVGALEVFLGAKEFMLHPFIILIVVMVMAVFLGKAFCSWGCPVPWTQKFFRPSKKRAKVDEGIPGRKEIKEGSDGVEGEANFLNDATLIKGETLPENGKDLQLLEKEEINTLVQSVKSEAGCKGGCSHCGLTPLGGKRDGFRIDSRHFVLLGALGSSALFGFPVFCLVCPVGLFFASFIGFWHLFQFNETSWGLLIFPAILILELVVFRKWCFKICPISALVSLFSNVKTFVRPKVTRSECLRSQGVDCHVCVDTCPEKVDPHSARIPECSKCGKCVEKCPASAIQIKLVGAERKTKTFVDKG